MTENHFSVVTVVRNDLLGLQKTRKSLESQSYKNWTHIIIDGASTDGSLEYLDSLSGANTFIVSEPDTGIYNAMNKAWKLADANSYVYYLNARDIFANEESLHEANIRLNAADNPNWGCTTHEEINEDGSGWVCKLVSPPSISNQLYAFGYRSHQAVVIKQSTILKLGGFDERFKIAADWDLIVRAIQDSEPAVWKHSLARFELGGMSSSNLLMAHEELSELRKKYLICNWKMLIFDYIWQAIYLRQFGYFNLVSIPLQVLGRLQNRFSKIISNMLRRISRFLSTSILIKKISSNHRGNNPILKHSGRSRSISRLNRLLRILPYTQD